VEIQFIQGTAGAFQQINSDFASSLLLKTALGLLAMGSQDGAEIGKLLPVPHDEFVHGPGGDVCVSRDRQWFGGQAHDLGGFAVSFPVDRRTCQAKEGAQFFDFFAHSMDGFWLADIFQSIQGPLQMSAANPLQGVAGRFLPFRLGTHGTK
jgi:hypothetical protein